MTATAAQIGAIHALAHKAGMDKDTRRDFLARETGKRSTKQITSRQAAHVIDRLKALTEGKAATLSGGHRVNPASAGAVAGLDSPVAGKMRALWIAGYDLGLVKDRSDRAMLAFLERQCGVSHTRFLREPGQASAAIEGLKDWLARDGHVEWPRVRPDVADNKRAVIDAQWAKLIALGAVTPFRADDPLAELDRYAFKVTWRQGWEFFEPRHYDQVQNALGRKLRAAIAKREA